MAVAITDSTTENAASTTDVITNDTDVDDHRRADPRKCSAAICR